MTPAVSTQVIRQALDWKGITVSKIRVLSCYIGYDNTQFVDFQFNFDQEDIANFAAAHEMAWQEVMIHEFCHAVESCFCADFRFTEWQRDDRPTMLIAFASFQMPVEVKQTVLPGLDNHQASIGNSADL